MDVDEEEIEMPSSSSGKGEKKRFEVKKVHEKWHYNPHQTICIVKMSAIIYVFFFVSVECRCSLGLGFVQNPLFLFINIR